MMVVVGTKGMLIKTFGILTELDRRCIEYFFINLGQHGERMSSLATKFKLRPLDVNLSGKEDVDSILSSNEWFVKSLRRAKPYFKKNQLVLIQGDTPSTLLGYILAKRCGSRVAHVEAGLRSHDLFEPLPEEIIRRTVDKGAICSHPQMKRLVI
jgi:UDP-N-acetylglucosamine 2-epimerase (non-hydrolysing)